MGLRKLKQLPPLSLTAVNHQLKAERGRPESLCLQVKWALCVSLRVAHWWRCTDIGWWERKHTRTCVHSHGQRISSPDCICIVGPGKVLTAGGPQSWFWLWETHLRITSVGHAWYFPLSLSVGRMCEYDRWDYVTWQKSGTLQMSSKSPVNWLSLNQKGGHSGWAWPNQTSPLKETRSSSRCWPVVLEEANCYLVRRAKWQRTVDSL